VRTGWYREVTVKSEHSHRTRGLLAARAKLVGMNAQQQMRWSPRGAHLMLKVRTAVMNRTLERDHAAAERWAQRPFRSAA
jgi:hypothetical protein